MIYDLTSDLDSRKKVSRDTATYSFDICPGTMSTCFLSHKVFLHNNS